MDKKTLGIITPTGNRPDAFKLCEKWLCAQTVKPNEWIVIDDGEPHTKISKVNDLRIWYCSTNHKWKEGENTQAKNLLEGLERFKHDYLAPIEDDDFYAPTYLEQMLNTIGTNDMVGLAETYYYLLPTQEYRQLQNKGYAILAQTLMTRQVAEEILKPLLLLNDGPFDQRLWQQARRHGLKVKLFHPEKPIAVGIKGMPGRGHAGRGLDRHKDLVYDLGASKFQELLGEDSLEYLPYLGKRK